MLRVAIASGLVLAMAVGTASASQATLKSISGPVLVDSGKGFAKVSVVSDLSAGSRVLVSKGGSAVLAYADGCTRRLAANTITTVDATDGCKSATQVAAQQEGDRQQFNGIWYVFTGASAFGIGWLIADASQSDNYIPVFIPISR